MKVSIVHDDQGSIVSITHAGPGSGQGVQTVPDSGQHLIDLELGDECRGKALLDLHQHYRVDADNKKLVAKR
jgi:hypothetical protein